MKRLLGLVLLCVISVSCSAESSTGFQDMSLSEAEEQVGFEINLPENIDGFNQAVVQVSRDNLVQSYYEGTADQRTLLIRKAQTQDDLSEDLQDYPDRDQLTYEEWTLETEGAEGFIHIASWREGDYSYLISSEEGIGEEDLLKILSQMK